MPLLSSLITAVGVAGGASTLTLPAPAAGQRQRILLLEVALYSTAARTGVSTPVTVTTTNLPGSWALTFATAAVIGSCDTKTYIFTAPLDAVVQATAVTVACPAVTGGMWRINCVYRNEEI